MKTFFLTLLLALGLSFPAFAQTQDTTATSFAGSGGAVGVLNGSFGSGVAIGGAGFLAGQTSTATAGNCLCIVAGPGIAILSESSSDTFGGAAVLSGGASSGSAFSVQGGLAAAGGFGFGDANTSFP